MYGVLLTSSLLRVWRQWQGRVGAIKDPDPPIFSYPCRLARAEPRRRFLAPGAMRHAFPVGHGHSFSSIKDYDGGTERQSVGH